MEGGNHTLFLVTTSPLAGRDWKRQKYQSEELASVVRNNPLIYKFKFHRLVDVE